MKADEAKSISDETNKNYPKLHREEWTNEVLEKIKKKAEEGEYETIIALDYRIYNDVVADLRTLNYDVREMSMGSIIRVYWGPKKKFFGLF